jgi:sporulation protein YlmC with PRC-barrel domain
MDALCVDDLIQGETAMMRSVKDLRGYAIRATDGVIGTVDDFYFDDEDWGIRYLVVDTGKWLSGRKVLISPVAIGLPDWMIQELPVSLTKGQVKRSPDIDTRYQVHATDGDIGHVDDLLVEDQTWAIQYLIVDTHGWWSGRRVLVAPRWIDDVSWSEATVSVDLTRHAIKGAPPYDADAQLDRQREQALHDHYDRPGYWTVRTRSRHAPRRAPHAISAARRRG